MKKKTDHPPFNINNKKNINSGTNNTKKVASLFLLLKKKTQNTIICT